MPIPLHISPRLITSVSSLYQDPTRVFLEFIDNALDSAEKLYSASNQSYLRPIQIQLQILDQSFQRIVSISDNCTGMERISHVVESIGNSEKKADFTTNGQFGYGIYSFMALFEKMEITTKTHQTPAKQMTIHRKQFDATRQEEVIFPEPETIEAFPYPSGTIITLSRCDKDKLRSFSAEKIHQEIERHFELLLRRKNLSITVSYRHHRHPGLHWEAVCKAFDYELLEGFRYESFESKWKNKIIPLHCYFLVTPRLNIDKAPIFVVKGRRISTLAETKSFDSKRKRDLWSHPNLTGYVDLKDWVQATFSRTDMKQDPHMKIVSKILQGMEEHLENMLNKISEEKKQSQFKALEQELMSALSQFALKEQVKLLSAMAEGKKPRMDHHENASEGKTPQNSEQTPDKEKPSFSHLSRRAGFDIRIVKQTPPLNEKQEQIRSQRNGNQILIFQQHPEFIKRMKVNLKKEWMVTPALISYLACEIAIHFRDEIIVSRGVSQYNKEQMIDFAEFVYRFEECLSALPGRVLKQDKLL
jgi:hypothetical protein